jgi:glycine cleavage system aminomethyltransferase T
VTTLAFLTSDAGDAVARSPMERAARAAGAEFELRDGWNVAVRYPGEEAWRGSGGFADVSHLRKVELHEGRGTPGTATRADGAWWCPMTPSRTLVIGDGAPVDDPAAVDVTTVFAAMTLVGPLAREVFARFTAIDLRPKVMPVGAFRPGSLARQPGFVLCEDADRYLFGFGWAVGEYMWTIVSDAAKRLGVVPIGADALVPSHA